MADLKRLTGGKASGQKGFGVLKGAVHRKKEKEKGKEEYLYSAFLAKVVHSKRSGMDHTVLPANNTSVHQMSPPQQLRQQTPNCSLLHIYQPRKDERLSWPSWLAYSGLFTHISGHPSATGRAQDSESTPAKDWCSTAGPHNRSGWSLWIQQRLMKLTVPVCHLQAALDSGLCRRLHVTRIQAMYDCDVFFPLFEDKFHRIRYQFKPQITHLHHSSETVCWSLASFFYGSITSNQITLLPNYIHFKTEIKCKWLPVCIRHHCTVLELFTI